MEKKDINKNDNRIKLNLFIYLYYYILGLLTEGSLSKLAECSVQWWMGDYGLIFKVSFPRTATSVSWVRSALFSFFAFHSLSLSLVGSDAIYWICVVLCPLRVLRPPCWNSGWGLRWACEFCAKNLAFELLLLFIGGMGEFWFRTRFLCFSLYGELHADADLFLWISANIMRKFSGREFEF